MQSMIGRILMSRLALEGTRSSHAVTSRSTRMPGPVAANMQGPAKSPAIGVEYYFHRDWSASCIMSYLLSLYLKHGKAPEAVSEYDAKMNQKWPDPHTKTTRPFLPFLPIIAIPLTFLQSHPGSQDGGTNFARANNRPAPCWLLVEPKHYINRFQECEPVFSNEYPSSQFINYLQCDALIEAGLGSHLLFASALDDAYNASIGSYYTATVRNVKPWCVLQPHSAEHVSIAVKTLASISPAGNWNVAVRGGGHSHWVNNNIAQGVTIDLNLMNQTQVHNSTSYTYNYTGVSNVISMTEVMLIQPTR